MRSSRLPTIEPVRVRVLLADTFQALNDVQALVHLRERDNRIIFPQAEGTPRRAIGQDDPALPVDDDDCIPNRIQDAAIQNGEN